MCEEIWKPIKNYENLFEISNLGRVKRLEREIKYVDGRKGLIKSKICNQYLNNKEYWMVNLYTPKTQKQKSFEVHYLMGISFLNYKPIKNKICIDHIDNNQQNNLLENLQIITYRENSSKDKKGYSSKYIGVCWDKSRLRWKASISINGKTKTLGRFKFEEDARDIYIEKLNEINKFGEYLK